MAKEANRLSRYRIPTLGDVFRFGPQDPDLHKVVGISPSGLSVQCLSGETKRITHADGTITEFVSKGKPFTISKTAYVLVENPPE